MSDSLFICLPICPPVYVSVLWSIPDCQENVARQS